jgi:aryl-alcohol dehydrogenase-like predicted oxidoreductase
MSAFRPAWWIMRANTLAELRGRAHFIGLQIEYSLIQRTVERERISMAQALNLSILIWPPLANGVLTGKYTAKARAMSGPEGFDLHPFG